MSAIQMSLGYVSPTVELPCAFIDQYMTRCAPVYALIYIHSLRQCIGGASVISSQEIAQLFHIMETDVLNAWRYWENAGLIRFDRDGDAIAVTFLPVPPAAAPIAAAPATTDELPAPLAVAPPPPALTPVDSTSAPETPEPPGQPEAAVIRPFTASNRPQYTVEELAVYRDQSRDIERLFSHAEQTLGKMLTYHDMNVLFGFYDWLRLPVDVIQYLLTYCTERDHRSLRYIEKAAIDWAEHQIDDLEKAFAYVQTFDRDYRDILQVLGQSSGVPSPTQRKYIEKWLHEYALSVDIILDACDRSSKQIGRPKLTYVDGILKKWHAKGVRSDEDIEADDEAYTRKKAESAKAEAKTPAAKGNRFINFKQRERDYAQLEKMEREYLVQSLKG